MSTREERAAARASWPISRHRLGESPSDVLHDVSPADCIAMVWSLTLDAWAAAGRPIPDYARADAPGRLLRRA
jgi:hypothetical protein